MSKEENKEYKAKLDDKILYLLRLKAMQEEVVDCYRTNNPERLYYHFMQDERYLGVKGDREKRGLETESYFQSLSKAIGYEDDSKNRKKRSGVKLANAWKLVRSKWKQFDGDRMTLSRCVKSYNGNLLTLNEAKERIANLFRFANYEEFKLAINTNNFTFPDSDSILSVDEQDFVARTLNYKDWYDMQGKLDKDPKVSVTSLKRAYGKAASNKPLSTTTLDCIANFICDKSWDDLMKAPYMVKEDLENDCLSHGSMTIKITRPRKNGAVQRIYSSRLKRGDKVKIIFTDDRELHLEFEGDYTYKVTYEESKILQVGYSLTIKDMHRQKIIVADEVFDENGDLIVEYDGYQTERVAKLIFEGIEG